MTTFIHSGYRTGSTWLRSRFRNNPSVVPYGEIFHENLTGLQIGDIPKYTPDNWANGRHPSGSPYGMEYVPLLQPEGGIAAYRKEMACERFLPPNGFDGELTADEVAYVQLLIDHARSVGKVPLLTDTRTLGRSASLKKAFGGVHILLYRNLFYQWCSFTQTYFEGERYFIDSVHHTLANCGQDHFLRDLFLLYPGPYEPTDRKALIAFLFLHIYLYCRNADVADQIIDIDMLSGAEYRADMEQRLAALTGVSVDLGGCRQKICYAAVDALNVDELRELLNSIPNMFLAGNPSAAARAMVQKCREDFLEALEQYQFYAGFLSSYIFGHNGLKQRAQAAEDAVQRQHQDLDRGAADLAALHAERDRLQADVAGLRHQIDELQERVCALQEGSLRHQEEACRHRDAAVQLGIRIRELEAAEHLAHQQMEHLAARETACGAREEELRRNLGEAQAKALALADEVRYLRFQLGRRFADRVINRLKCWFGQGALSRAS